MHTTMAAVLALGAALLVGSSVVGCTPTPTPVPPLKAAPAPTAAGAQPKAPADPARLLQNVQWLGHAAFRLTGDKTIYLDPYQLKTNVPADIILITHSHGDHCSPADVAKIKKPQTTIVTVADCAKFEGDVRTVKVGDALTVQGVSIEVVASYNVDKTNHPKANGWVGYIVTVNGVRIYHAGDTDRIPEMDALKVDVALLPAGGRYTMNASEAAMAANAIKPGVAVPMHWGAVTGTRADAEQFVQVCTVPAQIMTVTAD